MLYRSLWFFVPVSLCAATPAPCLGVPRLRDAPVETRTSSEQAHAVEKLCSTDQFDQTNINVSVMREYFPDGFYRMELPDCMKYSATLAYKFVTENKDTTTYYDSTKKEYVTEYTITRTYGTSCYDFNLYVNEQNQIMKCNVTSRDRVERTDKERGTCS